MSLKCLIPNNPKKYSNITAGEFLNERLIELGLIKNNGFTRPLKQLFPDHKSDITTENLSPTIMVYGFKMIPSLQIRKTKR